jgi:hypothetical protein
MSSLFTYPASLGDTAYQYTNNTGSGGFVTFSISASNNALACIFRAPNAEAITTVGLRYGIRTGTPPTYRISLQSVDPTTGNPTGTVLGGGSPASVTFTPPANATWDSTIQVFTLSNSYTPARGDVFAIVVEYSSGTVNVSNFSSFTSRASNVGLSINSVTPYVNTETAGVWTKAIGTPMLFWRTASATYGYPTQDVPVTLFASDSTPDEYALRFIVPATDFASYTVQGIRITTGAPDVAMTVKFSLYTGTTVLQDVTIDTDILRLNASAACGFWEVFFDEVSLTTLTGGSVYRIGMAAQNTSELASLRGVSVSANQDLSAYNGGIEWYLSTRTDAGAWTDDTLTRPWMSLILGSATLPNLNQLIQLPAA